MEQADFSSPPPQPSGVKVLAAGSSQGHRIELIEYSDGRVAIVSDGVEHAVYRRGVANLESCINIYLGMLRSASVDA